MTIDKGLAIAAFAAIMPVMMSAAAEAAPQPASIDLAPHRAIYEMRLKDALAGSNISDVKGRLVFDFEGSACSGYSLKSRLVTEVIDREGNVTVTDLRSATWENAEADKFRFNSSQYVDRRLSDQVEGLAARKEKKNAIEITIDKPEKRKLTLKGGAMFPTQHSIAILKAARQGETALAADIYDGSEKGDKLYETTTFIGKARPSETGLSARAIPNSEKLTGVPSWPVSISYYEPAANPARDEGLPVYELSFRLFANGVSEDLVIDYGTFSIRGELSQIEFHKPAACAASRK